MKRSLLSGLIAWILIADVASAQTAKILVSGRSEKEGDTISISVHESGSFDLAPEFTKHYSAVIKNGLFRFEITAAGEPVSFDLRLRDKAHVNYLAESGDSLVLDMRAAGNPPGGRGCAKLIVKDLLDETDAAIKSGLARGQSSLINRDFQLADSALYLKMAILDKWRSEISQEAYSLLLADIVADNLSKGYYIMHYIHKENRAAFIHALRDYRDPAIPRGVPDDHAKEYSRNYIPALISKYQFDSCFMKQQPFSFSKSYQYFSENYSGTLRDKLLSFLVYTNRRRAEAIRFLDTTLLVSSSGKYLAVLKRLKSTLSGGSDVSGFVLSDEQGQAVPLSRFKGKVMVLDFWYTGCPACPQVLPFLRKVKGLFPSDSLAVVSISIDKQMEKWKKGLSGGIYTFRDEIHLYTGGMGDKHPVIKHFDIGGYPAIFVVDINGRLCDIPADPRKDEGNDLNRIVRQALKGCGN